MFVIIVGGGKTGSQLATQLLSGGHKVKLVEDRPAVLERLREELPDEVIIAGDGSSPSVLEAAGIEDAQVLAAVTGEDEDTWWSPPWPVLSSQCRASLRG